MSKQNILLPHNSTQFILQCNTKRMLCIHTYYTFNIYIEREKRKCKLKKVVIEKGNETNESYICIRPTYIDAYKATNQDNLQHLKELQFNTEVSMSSSQSLDKR